MLPALLDGKQWLIPEMVWLSAQNHHNPAHHWHWSTGICFPLLKLVVAAVWAIQPMMYKRTCATTTQWTHNVESKWYPGHLVGYSWFAQPLSIDLKRWYRKETSRDNDNVARTVQLILQHCSYTLDYGCHDLYIWVNPHFNVWFSKNRE